jgi:hypothetical protein
VELNVKTISRALADKPFIAAFGTFVAALLASLGLADLSSSAVAVVDAAAGLVVTVYVAGNAHVTAQTVKAAAATPSAPASTAAVSASVAQVLKTAAEALSSSGG